MASIRRTWDFVPKSGSAVAMSTIADWQGEEEGIRVIADRARTAITNTHRCGVDLGNDMDSPKG